VKPYSCTYCQPRETPACASVFTVTILMEWQKRAEQKDNWRVKHLAYLRMQLGVEQETYAEIKAYAPCAEDLFHSRQYRL
jgi:hypothetical protein